MKRIKKYQENIRKIEYDRKSVLFGKFPKYKNHAHLIASYKYAIYKLQEAEIEKDIAKMEKALYKKNLLASLH